MGSLWQASSTNTNSRCLQSVNSIVEESATRITLIIGTSIMTLITARVSSSTHFNKSAVLSSQAFFSFLFVLSSASCQSVQALASFHVFSLHHPTLLQNRERNYRPNHRFDSRNSINRSNNIFSGVGYYYTSSPFYDGNDEMTSPKNNNNNYFVPLILCKTKLKFFKEN